MFTDKINAYALNSLYHKCDTKKAIQSNSVSKNVTCDNPILTARPLNFIYHCTHNKMPQPKLYRKSVKVLCKRI